MKRPQPDIDVLLRVTHLNRLAFLRKFRKYWGTTFVNGVEVYSPKAVYYNEGKAIPEYTQRAIKLLGQSKVLSADYDGLDRAWFFLDHSKAADTVPSDPRAAIVENLAFLPTGTPLVLTIGPKSGQSPVVFDAAREVNGVKPRLPDIQAALAAEVKDKFDYIWATYSLGSGEPQDAYKHALAVNAFRTGDMPCTITKVTRVATKREVPGTTIPVVTDSYRVQFTVDKYPEDMANSNIVDLLTAAATATVAYSKLDEQGSTVLVGGLSNANALTVRSKLQRPPRNGNDGIVNYSPLSEPPNSALWLTVPGEPVGYDDGETIYGEDIYYLRASALEDGSTLGMMQDRINYLTPLFGSDYEETPATFWESLIVFILIVAAIAIAIAITYFTGGLGAGLGSAIMAMAATVTMVSLALQVFTMIAVALGQSQVAKGLSSFNASIAPLVRIASYLTIAGLVGHLADAAVEEGILTEEQAVVITVVAAVYSGYQSSGGSTDAEVATEVGTEVGVEVATEVGVEVATEVGVEVATEVGTELSASMMADILGDFLADTAAAAGDYMANFGAKELLRVTGIIYPAWAQYDLGQMRKESEDIRKETAKLEEGLEKSKSTHPYMDMIPLEGLLLSKDSSVYASHYDLPYEAWTTNYHIGNIQSTSVSALWLADKKKVV